MRGGPTNKQCVLEYLRRYPNTWVSGQELVDAGGGWRYGARIYELRKDGHVIEERSDPTGRSAVGQYRIIMDDKAPGQVGIWS